MNDQYDTDHDNEYDNAHRCLDCGVTGGGVENSLCEGCFTERARHTY